MSIINFQLSIHTSTVPLSRSIIDKTLRATHGEAAYKIVETLLDAGHDAWWVGGCVRDMLQGIVPADIDIASDALPEAVRALFPKSASWPEKHGSTRVPLAGELFEVTTFREDDEASDGRHPESIRFANREKDAARRDFTVNAMYFQPISGALYDPFDGEADLEEKLIRFVGDPATRIRHDALRILRAVRFRAQLEGQYHPETYAALREQSPMLDVLSGTRILEELEKLLACPHPDRGLEDMWELGLLQRVLPELHVCKGIPQPADYHHEGDVWDHTLQLVRAFRPDDDADVRLAGLFHDCGKAETFSLKERIRFDGHAEASASLATKALSRMQCPRKRVEKIDWIIRHHMMMGAFDDMTDERKAHWYHHPWFESLLRLFWLDVAGTDPADFGFYEAIERDYHAFLDSHPRPEKPLLSGQEVMDILGLKPGEKVGEILKQLHEAQVRKEVRSKKEATAFVERLKGE